MHRIFIAIELPVEVVHFVNGHIDMLKRIRERSRVSWAKAGNMHLTVRFLGDIEGEMLPRINECVFKATATTRPFVLTVFETGAAPNRRRPKVLWFDVQDPTGTLQMLKNKMDERLANLGFEPDVRSFQPHLTIARLRNPNGVRPMVERHLETVVEPIDFLVTRLAVVESKLTRSGSEYSNRFVAKLC